MAQHLIELWIEGDDDPNEVDWRGFAEQQGFRLHDDTAVVKTFPWAETYHEVNWWITRPMTLDEWSDLDDAETEVLSRILGDNYVGTAGPIPFGDEHEKVRAEWLAKQEAVE